MDDASDDRSSQDDPEPRAPEKWRFILVRGVFLWGYPVGLLAETVDLFELAVHWPRFESAADAAVFLVIWTLAGALYGWWLWRARASSPADDAAWGDGGMKAA